MNDDRNTDGFEGRSFGSEAKPEQTSEYSSLSEHLLDDLSSEIERNRIEDGAIRSIAVERGEEVALLTLLDIYGFDRIADEHFRREKALLAREFSLVIGEKFPILRKACACLADSADFAVRNQKSDWLRWWYSGVVAGEAYAKAD